MVLSADRELSFVRELPQDAILVLIPSEQPRALAVGSILVNNPCCLLEDYKDFRTWTFAETRHTPSLRFFSGVVHSANGACRTVFVGFVQQLLPIPERPNLIVVDNVYVGHDSAQGAALRLLNAIIE